MALARPAPGGLPIVQVTCVVDSETGETISRAWASCVGQAAVDVRARAWWHWDFNTPSHSRLGSVWGTNVVG